MTSVIFMANEGVEHELFFEDATDDKVISVLCTFKKENTISALLSFRFGQSTQRNTKGITERRIENLQIHFLSYNNFNTRRGSKE